MNHHEEFEADESGIRRELHIRTRALVHALVHMSTNLCNTQTNLAIRPLLLRATAALAFVNNSSSAASNTFRVIAALDEILGYLDLILDERMVLEENLGPLIAEARILRQLYRQLSI